MATTTQTTRSARLASSASTDRQNGQHGRIVSDAPGRLRVRLHQDHRQPEVFDKVQQALGGHPGVSDLTTNDRTGSILVRYDREAFSSDDLRAMLRDVGVVIRELAGAEEIPEDLGLDDVPTHSTTAVSLLDALTDLDRRLSRLTGGKLDVKLLVPASLGLLALRQIATNGLGLSQVPGYVLLWYTFDSFYKLHQRKAEQTRTGGAEKPGEQADGSNAGGTG